jgi:hypothetical protein
MWMVVGTNRFIFAPESASRRTSGSSRPPRTLPCGSSLEDKRAGEARGPRENVRCSALGVAEEVLRSCRLGLRASLQRPRDAAALRPFRSPHGRSDGTAAALLRPWQLTPVRRSNDMSAQDEDAGAVRRALGVPMNQPDSSSVADGGFAASDTSAAEFTDPISGREWITDSTSAQHSGANVDLEYACTFKLPMSRDCSDAATRADPTLLDSCDCTPPVTGTGLFTALRFPPSSAGSRSRCDARRVVQRHPLCLRPRGRPGAVREAHAHGATTTYCG